MGKKGFRYDLTKCIGCRSCVVGCRFEQNTPADLHYRWVAVQERGYYGATGANKLRVQFVSIACNHCDEPACLKACPTQAIKKDAAGASEGAVWIDTNLCVGCRRCAAVCPYGAPQYNIETGKMNKCNLCRERLLQGLNPACVRTCVGETLRLADFSTTPITNGNEPEGFAPRKHTHPNIEFIK